MASGSTPDFDCSPARFTCTRAGTSSRRAAESESSEWASSQVRFTTFTLFDWRWPMKCQANASPYSACFASRSWARFSPTILTPASTSVAISRSGTYFVAATTVTAGPTSAWMRARRSRIVSGDGTEHPLHAARAAVAPVREEELRMVARAEVDPLDALDPCPAQRALRRGPEVELAAGREVVVEQRGDLRPDVVAARPDRRPDDRDERVGLVAAQGIDTGLDDALRKPAPAGVQDRERTRALRARDRDRQAVGRHGED